MLRPFLRAKLHRARVTRADLDYVGSITIDRDLLDAAGLSPLEQVDVLNITNGSRLTTYCIAGERGSGEIGINGAAAHHAAPGDLVIVCAYCELAPQEVAGHHARVVIVADGNRVGEVLSQSTAG